MRAKVRNVTFLGLVTGVVLSTSLAFAGQVASGNNYTVTASDVSCAANADCKIDLKLQAGSGFHVNAEYPYKFKAGDAPSGVTYLGKDPAGTNIFSKAAGDFAVDSGNPQVGTMSIKFKSANRGAVHIAGVFKLSVCSAANCQLEQANVTVPVTIR